MYKHLKSGTDIRGIASDIFGGTINLTDEAVYDIARGFARFLSQKTGKKPCALRIAVGHDSRITAGRIKTQVISALMAEGVSVGDCALSSTPAMFMTTVLSDFDGAVQITASHHPADRNGLKFFCRDGGLDGKDIDTILALCDHLPACTAHPGKVESVPFMDTYAAHLRKIIREALQVSADAQPLTGLHIVVDAGNGAGGFYATQVLAPLGADISGSVYLEPDGMFPNHIPNPEDKKAMESICRAVLDAKADFGVIFDTDVDRAGCVDRDGCEINRNRLVALAASIVLKDEPGATIVTDSVTSDGLRKFIDARGGKHHRFKRGYKNVINEAIRLCNAGQSAPLAIETSGHAALRENYFLDDGAYLITKIIIQLVQMRPAGKVLSDLYADLEMPLEADELRFAIKEADFKAYGNAVLAALEAFAAAKDGWTIADDNREGIRVSTPHGWFLLRLSVHDPIMPFNVESTRTGGNKATLQALLPFFMAQAGLDIVPLTQRLQG